MFLTFDGLRNANVRDRDTRIKITLQRAQAVLPLNPAALPAVDPNVAFNTAISFATNTNWQGYAGEATMSYLT